MALVVLSVGLLGVAKLVLGAVHADDSAYMRGQATQLAYELLDQMRANRPGAIASNYCTRAGGQQQLRRRGVHTTELAQLDLFNCQKPRGLGAADRDAAPSPWPPTLSTTPSPRSS